MNLSWIEKNKTKGRGPTLLIFDTLKGEIEGIVVDGEHVYHETAWLDSHYRLFDYLSKNTYATFWDL